MRSRLFVCAYILIMLAAAPGLPAQDASAHPAQYRITDLGPLPGGDFSQATFISNNGLITGISTAADAAQHAVAWSQGSIFPLGNLLGGPNSGAVGVNEAGLVSGQAEVSQADPNNENFCAYFTGLQCRPFAWHRGAIKQLPTLGGNNGTVGPPNRRGQIPGMAETNAIDPSCPTKAAVNGTGPQVLQFEPVVWDANAVTVHQLPLPASDTVGMALWLNNQGQAVGTTGTCANTLVPPFAAGPHAVVWDKDGSVHNLGNLGGTANPSLLGIGNVAFAINDQVQITGVSVLPGN